MSTWKLKDKLTTAMEETRAAGTKAAVHKILAGILAETTPSLQRILTQEAERFNAKYPGSGLDSKAERVVLLQLLGLRVG